MAYLSVCNDDLAGQRAAADFADRLEEMTGCRLTDKPFPGGVPVRIGRCAENSVSPKPDFRQEEGFWISVTETGVWAYGNDADPFEGTALAVTALLDALGFGWYGPDPLWQIVPYSPNAVLPGVNLLSRPHFSCRRTRVLEHNPQLGRRWGLGGVRSEVEHKYGSFFSPEKWENIHPEYYALSGGVRATKNKKWWQLCLSNKEVQKEMARQVCEFFQEHPEWKGLSIGQNDGNGDIDSIDYANWCECNQCRTFADSPSEAVLKFSGRVGSLVYEKFPEHTVMFYGYFGTYPAPKISKKEPIPPNVQLTLCKECGFTGRIRTDESCHDEEHPPFRENFYQWKSTGVQHIAIYEWNCPGAANPAWKEAFWVQGDVGLDNLRWFYENGVDFVYFDQGPNSSYERLENVYSLRWPLWYCSAHGMWNTNLTFEDLLAPACRRLFGAAGETMLSFYRLLSDANAACRVPHFNWGLPMVGEVYPMSVLDAGDRLMEAAEQTVGITSQEIERIAGQRVEWEKTKRMAAKF